MFVAVQHPGEEGSFEAQHSAFPDYVGAGAAAKPGQARLPRPSVVRVFRGDSWHFPTLPHVWRLPVRRSLTFGGLSAGREGAFRHGLPDVRERLLVGCRMCGSVCGGAELII